jgi:hypothetical protein
MPNQCHNPEKYRGLTMQSRWLFLALLLFNLLLLPPALANNGNGNGNGGPHPTPTMDAATLTSLAAAGYVGYQSFKAKQKKK